MQCFYFTAVIGVAKISPQDSQPPRKAIAKICSYTLDANPHRPGLLIFPIIAVRGLE